MTALPLVFDAPKRALPPRHFADLPPAERRAAVAELGLPAFRADQLARHYFGHLTADVAAMTDLPAAPPPPPRHSSAPLTADVAAMPDLPAAARESLAALLPPLVTPDKELACDDGATRKTLWTAHDGTRAETVLMRYPDRATVCVS